MANYLATDTDLTAVADAIREKGGTSASLSFPSGYVSAIQAIPSCGGVSLTMYTATNTPVKSNYSLTFQGVYKKPIAFWLTEVAQTAATGSMLADIVGILVDPNSIMEYDIYYPKSNPSCRMSKVIADSHWFQTTYDSNNNTLYIYLDAMDFLSNKAYKLQYYA